MFLSTVCGELQLSSGTLCIFIYIVPSTYDSRFGMKTLVSVDVLEQTVWPNTAVLWTPIDIGMMRLVCVFVRQMTSSHTFEDATSYLCFRLNVPQEVSLTLATVSVGMGCHSVLCLRYTVLRLSMPLTQPRWPPMLVSWPLEWSPSPYWSHYTSWQPRRGHTETSDTQGKNTD